MMYATLRMLQKIFVRVFPGKKFSKFKGKKKHERKPSLYHKPVRRITEFAILPLKRYSMLTGSVQLWS